MANRYQQDMNTPLSYSNTTVPLTTNYPFANGKPFAYSTTAGSEGAYMERFRSTAEADNTLKMADKNILRTGRRGIKLNFYPKCKKPIDLTIDTLHFGSVTDIRLF